MAKYHAGRNGKPMCGQTGAIGGFTAVSLGPADWNMLEPAEKCQKCVQAIKVRKAASTKH